MKAATLARLDRLVREKVVSLLSPERVIGIYSEGRLKFLEQLGQERPDHYVPSKDLEQEFHVMRTGGIETWSNIINSEEAGVSLNQWFTGYFHNFSIDGHNLYRTLIEKEN